MNGTPCILPHRSWWSSLLAVFLLSFIGGCDLINPDEPVPVYLACDSISFNTTSAAQGSASSSIVDVWAYVDGKLIGGFEMPARFPALAEGTHELTFSPGILVNGIRSTRGPYPFYESFDTTIVCVPGQEYTILPRTTYRSQAAFPLVEDFEQTGLYFERGPGSDTTLNIINDANAFESHSGVIYLDPLRSYFNYRSSPPFTVTAGSTVFAELNYKCDNEFNVGVVSQVGASEVSEEVLTIRPSSTWKKIYVNLSGAISNEPFASGYKLLLTAVHSNGTLSSTIYLDNIKVLR